MRTWYLLLLGLLTTACASHLEMEWVPLIAVLWGVISILGFAFMWSWRSKAKTLDQIRESSSTIELVMPTGTSRIHPRKLLRREIVALIFYIFWIVILQIFPIFEVQQAWIWVTVCFSFTGVMSLIRVVQALEEYRSPSSDHIVITKQGILWLGLPVPEFQRWKNIKQAMWIEARDVSGLKLELKNDRTRELLPAIIDFKGIDKADQEKLLQVIGERVTVVRG